MHDKFTTSFVDFNLPTPSSPRTEFNGFQMLDQAAFELEAQQGPHLVKSLSACCAWIQVEPTPGRVFLTMSKWECPQMNKSGRWAVSPARIPLA